MVVVEVVELFVNDDYNLLFCKEDGNFDEFKKLVSEFINIKKRELMDSSHVKKYGNVTLVNFSGDVGEQIVKKLSEYGVSDEIVLEKHDGVVCLLWKGSKSLTEVFNLLSKISDVFSELGLDFDVQYLCDFVDGSFINELITYLEKFGWKRVRPKSLSVVFRDSVVEFFE